MGNVTATVAAGESKEEPANMRFALDKWEFNGTLPRVQVIRRTKSHHVIRKPHRDLHVPILGERPPNHIANFRRSDFFYPEMIPEPDYSDSEEDGEHKHRLNNHARLNSNGSNGTQYSEDGLILPKKPANPCKESQERQNLHKELLFNQKIGKKIVGQKSELQKAMEKFREDQKKKDLEEERLSKRTALELRLEQQANKLKEHEKQIIKEQEPKEDSEFRRVHARVCAPQLPIDSKS